MKEKTIRKNLRNVSGKKYKRQTKKVNKRSVSKKKIKRNKTRNKSRIRSSKKRYSRKQRGGGGKTIKVRLKGPNKTEYAPHNLYIGLNRELKSDKEFYLGDDHAPEVYSDGDGITVKYGDKVYKIEAKEELSK